MYPPVWSGLSAIASQRQQFSRAHYKFDAKRPDMDNWGDVPALTPDNPRKKICKEM
jgi:hypothetical protein